MPRLHVKRIDTVGFVDRGDDPQAMLTFWKRAPVEKAMKTEAGVQFPAAAYAYVPDPQTPSTWKLRLWETPSSKATARQVGMAIAALGPGGFRGNRVQIPSGDLAGVKAKVRSAWKSVNGSDKEMPAVLKNDDTVLSRVLKLLGLKDEDVDKLLAEGAGDGGDNDDGTNHNGDGDMANDDVAKLKADLEAAEKRAQEAEAALADAAGGDDLAKRLDALEKKAKDSEERAEAAEKKLQDEVDRREREQFIGKARSFAALPGMNADDFGPILRKIDKALDEDERTKFDTLLKAADAAIKEGALLKEVGSGDRPGASVEAQVEELAKELQAKEPGLSKQAARGKIWKQRPDLAAAYEKERSAAAPTHEED